MKWILTCVLLFCLILSRSQNFEWINTYGSLENDRITDLKIDRSGDIVITGTYEQNIRLGMITLTHTEGKDFFVAKLTRTGDVLWAIPFGGIGDDISNSLSIDAQNTIYVGGEFSSSMVSLTGSSIFSTGGLDAFILNMDPSGVLLWVHAAGGPLDDAVTDIFALDDRVLLTGFFETQMIFSSPVQPVFLQSFGGRDAFVAEYSSQGGLNWAKSYGGVGEDGSNQIIVTADDEIFIGGYVTPPAVFGNVNVPPNINLLGRDGFTAKTDNSGNPYWVNLSASPDLTDEVTHLANDQKGNVYATGNFRISLKTGNTTLFAGVDKEGFVQSFDPDGHLRWVTSTIGNGPNHLKGLVIGSDEYMYMTGSVVNSTKLKGHLFSNIAKVDGIVSKFTLDGDHVASTNFGSPGELYLSSVDMTDQGELYIGGYFIDRFTAMGLTFNSKGEKDAILAQLELSNSTKTNDTSAPWDKIWFDPVNSQLHIETTSPGTDKPFILYNAQGMILNLIPVKEEVVYKVNAPPGIYFLAGQTATFKFIQMN